MKKIQASLNMDPKMHSTLKIESAIRKIPMKKIVNDALIEYFEKHKIENKEKDQEI